jgi:hypothetical protein
LLSKLLSSPPTEKTVEEETRARKAEIVQDASTMDSYPGDLLAGVFPLVFAVDAITPAPAQDPSDLEQRAGNDVVEKEDAAPKPTSKRILFDRFLDALASSQVSEEDTPTKSRTNNTNPLRSDTLSSLMRNEEDDSSDDEDQSMDSGSQASKSSRPFRRGVGSPLSMPTFRKPPTSKTASTESTGYARNLTTEKFFGRARILASSTRHGFPPSKDESGADNFALHLSQARSAMVMNPTRANAQRLKNVLENKQMDGILPQGWLEKHVHALPSVLLLVTSYQSNMDQQDKQDERLFETVEHMRESLATKRECSIHLVVLTEMTQKSDEWISRIRSNTQLLGSEITMVHTDDLNAASAGPGMPSSPVMKKLHKTIRDASWTYYQNQARQAKRKLSMLGHDQQLALLPLAIRYAFKIAVFYEFQLKHEKSLKFFAESYRHVQTYYRHMLGKTISWDVNPQGDDEIETSLADQTPNSGELFDEDNVPGIEVTLDDDDDEDEEDDKPGAILDIRAVFSEMKPHADISHQCRAVADWLNFKLIQAGFQAMAYSDSEEGLLAASTQWRKHSQVFLKENDPSNPTWHFWKYVCNQRQVMSQLVERYPPKSIQALTELARDEVLMRCSAWRNYSAAAEAMLRLGVEAHKACKEGDTATTSTTGTDKSSKTILRGRFVGGLDSDGLWPKLEEESKQDHKGKSKQHPNTPRWTDRLI